MGRRTRALVPIVVIVAPSRVSSTRKRTAEAMASTRGAISSASSDEEVARGSAFVDASGEVAPAVSASVENTVATRETLVAIAPGSVRAKISARRAGTRIRPRSHRRVPSSSV